MPVNREIWKESFSINDFSKIRCTFCKNGILIANKNCITDIETEVSKRTRDYGDFYDETDYVGSCHILLACNICNEVFHLIGKSKLDIEVDEDYERIPHVSYISSYFPASIYPAPHLITLNENIPKEVTAELILAFALFWLDYSACGNKIRIAVERLLDTFKIPRNKDDGRLFMLHERIAKLEQVMPKCHDISDKLLAIKWLGNEASHAQGLTKEDVFDALDLLEYVLDELFDGKRDKLRQLTEQINKNKGSIYKR